MNQLMSQVNLGAKSDANEEGSMHQEDDSFPGHCHQSLFHLPGIDNLQSQGGNAAPGDNNNMGNLYQPFSGYALPNSQDCYMQFFSQGNPMSKS